MPDSINHRVAAYARTGRFTIQFVVGLEPEEREVFSRESTTFRYGWNDMWVTLQKHGHRKLWIRLTEMTEEELDVFQKIINHACESARHVVRDLDEKALELFDQGVEEMPIRAFASSPPFFIRKHQDRILEGPGAIDAEDSQRGLTEVSEDF